MIKVTSSTLKLNAIWNTIITLPLLTRVFISDIKLCYYRYLNATIKAYIENPDIKWSRANEEQANGRFYRK